MAIQFRDFLPATRPTKVLGILPDTEYGSFEGAVERMNAWVRKAGVRVVTVETVLLPAVEGPKDCVEGRFVTRYDFNTSWVQVVRVWYEEAG